MFFYKAMAMTAKEELQRLKPLCFCSLYVVAEATTHKDSQESTRHSRFRKDPRVNAL